MRLSFLGTGAAMSTTRCNVASLIDRRLLVDAGAPLVTQLTRIESDPDAVQAVLITHFHGDHLLGLPSFLLRRVVRGVPPLMIMGPVGVEECVERLCQAAWGAGWRDFGDQGSLEFVAVEAGSRVQTDEYEIDVVHMEHDSGIVYATPSVAYRIYDGRMRVGFTGDAAPGPWADTLLEGCDAAVVDCTGPDPGPTHLSDEDVRGLSRRHSAVRMFLHHFASEAPVIRGATATADLEEVEL